MGAQRSTGPAWLLPTLHPRPCGRRPQVPPRSLLLRPNLLPLHQQPPLKLRGRTATAFGCCCLSIWPRGKGQMWHQHLPARWALQRFQPRLRLAGTLQ